MNYLFSALVQAAQAAGLPPVLPPKTQRKWAGPLQDKKTSVIWEHELFGELVVTVNSGLELEEPKYEGNAAWAEIKGNQPKGVNLEFEATLQRGVELFRGAFKEGGQRSRMDPVNPTTLSGYGVGVRWFKSEKGVMIPQTHGGAVADDLAFVLMTPQGHFVQIEVAIRGIATKLFVTLQETYNGQVTVTNKEVVRKIGCSSVDVGPLHSALAVPLYDDYGYPGSDYVKSFGPVVVQRALDLKRTIPFSQATVSDWRRVWSRVEFKNDTPEGVTQAHFGDPNTLPESLTQKGFMPCRVMFYNMAWHGGAGFGELQNGDACFLHHKHLVSEDGVAVVKKGEFPYLDPGSLIAVKVEPGSGGKKKAEVIRKV